MEIRDRKCSRVERIFKLQTVRLWKRMKPNLVRVKQCCRLEYSLNCLYIIQECTTAVDIWEKYQDKGLCRKIGLLHSLISTRLESCDGIQQYVDEILNHSSKLSGIGFKMSDEWIVAILLAGLTEDFKPFIMVEASKPLTQL